MVIVLCFFGDLHAIFAFFCLLFCANVLTGNLKDAYYLWTVNIPSECSFVGIKRFL